ncbi:MAG: LEPR-XLL domain-containing protein, partial [Planctomycetales bacterium]|nr:LEPR-XLL domain-containing protein [Planctomycetales bacterium]
MPMRSWKNFWHRLGFRKTRRKSRRARSKLPQFEPLEPRKLLAADLVVQSFTADGVDLHVGYDVLNENATAFDVTIYRSSDGVALDAAIATQRVTDSALLAVGTGHEVTIAPSFADPWVDYFLVAKVDAANEIAESDETNNNRVFGKGVFEAGGVVYVHGDAQANALDITLGATLDVTLDGSTYSYTPAAVSTVHARLHEGDDTVTSGGHATGLLLFGGAGADSLQGGDSADYLLGGEGNDALDGGAGDDSAYGGAGDDYLEGRSGNDILWGEAGDDTYVFGSESDLGSDYVYEYSGSGVDTFDFSASGDYVYVDLSVTYGQTVIWNSLSITLADGQAIENAVGGNYGNSIYGNSLDNTLVGGDSYDYLVGGAGNDYLYGGAGDDYLDNGEGYD